jgi:2'-5' RNA ligase
MVFDPNGGRRSVPVEERLNVFALVAYIPDPLGKFLDDLRRDLVPSYNPHAHISVLPPRPLGVDWQEASEMARGLAESWAPFDVELKGIRSFPVTEVIYIELGSGAEELCKLHAAMNSGELQFDEPFPYHPHVTLAQEVDRADLPGIRQVAQRRWAEYKGPRTFRVDRAVFVQNTLDNRWIDLAEYSFGAVAVR